MDSFIIILKIIGWCIVIPAVAFAAVLTLYMLKQIRWETNLKRYRKGQLGVYNPQGVLITTPEELLDELKGIEESIAKRETQNENNL